MNDALASSARSGSLYSLGVSYLQRGQFAEAERAFAEAARINPNLGELHGARGAALSHLGRHDEALAAYDRALASNPKQAALWNNRGNALLQLGRHAEAVATYDRALAIKSDYTDAWRHRGLALTLLGQPERAIESLDKALALEPNDSGTLEDKSHLLMRLNRHAEAESAYTKAIAVRPANAGLHYNRANALSILMRYGEAISECRKALAIDPDYPYARGVLIHSKLQSCDWRGLEEDKAAIDAALKLGKRTVSPFNYKALSDSPEADQECARVWIANERPVNLMPLAAGARYGHSRIRLAYVSADFNLSAVATAMAGVFEKHDRNRFETFAISFGSNAPTPMRARLRAAFDHFLDLREKTDAEIPNTMRDQEIDIAVDLMGYTGECRSWILARRPAPVQVNYLGFAGTMAADHIDYILADRIVIPEESKAHYAEKVVYLPDCYLPHDSSRAIAEHRPAPAAQGLPNQGFVFASFNNAYKFSRPMFDIWMRLLKSVAESVLWLPKSHPEAMANLSREAEARGVSARRLIFAPPVEAPEEHLARLRLADLFLDTSPYNAHSSAMDALWAGVPVLTSPGHSFQARVAASLLKACDLSGMVVPLAQYEAAALNLARNPDGLSAVREKLAANRKTTPLFDTERFTRGLEAAFIRMWERHERGEPPESFAVAST